MTLVPTPQHTQRGAAAGLLTHRQGVETTLIVVQTNGGLLPVMYKMCIQYRGCGTRVAAAGYG